MPNDFDTEVSIVVPTFNEYENVREIYLRISSAMGPIAWEIIFVDDASPDGTSDAVRNIARHDSRVRLICRHNRRGLSTAVVEGALAASADIVAVIDGDLQHDEAVLPQMIKMIEADEADVVSASRFLGDTVEDGLGSQSRVRMSEDGIKLANRLLRLNLTDPLTGFFVAKRSIILDALPNLSQVGFKILLDVLTASKDRPRVKEVPFEFRKREHGDSKLDKRVVYDFGLFLVERTIGRIIPLPAHFLSFAMINSVGILVHLMVLYPLIKIAGMGFGISQLLATLVAMFFNFAVNNALTYRNQSLTGARFYRGFMLFMLLCSVGIFANVSVASMLHTQYATLNLSLSSTAGALITVVWNYVASKAFIWGRERRSMRAHFSTSPQSTTFAASQKDYNPTN